MKRRGHLQRDPDGTVKIDHCPDDGTVLTVKPHVDGAPIYPGQCVVDYRLLDDGHVEYETSSIIGSGGGPAQVATEAYRRGYDETFGTKEVN